MKATYDLLMAFTHTEHSRQNNIFIVFTYFFTFLFVVGCFVCHVTN